MEPFQENNVIHQISQIAEALQNKYDNNNISENSTDLKTNIQKLLELINSFLKDTSDIDELKNKLSSLETIYDELNSLLENFDVDEETDDSDDINDSSNLDNNIILLLRNLFNKLKTINDTFKLINPPGPDSKISPIIIELISNLDYNTTISKPTFLTFIDNYSNNAEISYAYIIFRDGANKEIPHYNGDLDYDALNYNESDSSDSDYSNDIYEMREAAKCDGTYDNINKILINEPGIYKIKCRLIDFNNEYVLSDSYEFNIIYDPKIIFDDEIHYIINDNEEEKLLLYINIYNDNLKLYNYELFNICYKIVNNNYIDIYNEENLNSELNKINLLNETLIEVKNNTIIFDISNYLDYYKNDGLFIKYRIEYDDYVSNTIERYLEYGENDSDKNILLSDNNFIIDLFDESKHSLKDYTKYSNEASAGEDGYTSITHLYSNEYYNDKIHVLLYPENDNTDLSILSWAFHTTDDLNEIFHTTNNLNGNLGHHDDGDGNDHEVGYEGNNEGNNNVSETTDDNTQESGTETTDDNTQESGTETTDDNTQESGTEIINEPNEHDNNGNTIVDGPDGPSGPVNPPTPVNPIAPIISSSFINGNNSSITVTITSENEDAIIYYTINEENDPIFDIADIGENNNPPEDRPYIIKYDEPFYLIKDTDNNIYTYKIKACCMYDNVFSDITEKTISFGGSASNPNDIILKCPNISINGDLISINSLNTEYDTTIFYTLNNTEPTLDSYEYHTPFRLHKSCIITAKEYLSDDYEVFSPIVSLRVDIYNDEPYVPTYDNNNYTLPTGIYDVTEYGNNLFNENIKMTYTFNSEEHEFSYFYTFKRDNDDNNLTYIGTYIPANTWSWQEDQKFTIKLYNTKFNKEYAYAYTSCAMGCSLRNIIDTYNMQMLYSASHTENDTDIYYYPESSYNIIHVWTDSCKKYKVNDDSENNDFYSLPSFNLYLQDSNNNIINYSDENKGYYHMTGLSNNTGWRISYSKINYKYNFSYLHKLENNESTNEEYCLTLINLARNGHLNDYNYENEHGVLSLSYNETLICGYADRYAGPKDYHKILYKNSCHIVEWNLVEPDIRGMILPDIFNNSNDNSRFFNLNLITFKVLCPQDGEIAINPSLYNTNTLDSALIFFFNSSPYVSDWTVEWSINKEFINKHTFKPLNEELKRDDNINNYYRIEYNDNNNNPHNIYYRLKNSKCNYVGEIHQLTIIQKYNDDNATDGEILQLLLDNDLILTDDKLSDMITTPYNWENYKPGKMTDNDLIYFKRYKKYVENNKPLYFKTQKLTLSEVDSLNVEPIKLSNDYEIYVPYYIRNGEKTFLGIHVDENNIKYWNNNVYDETTNEAIISFECIDWTTLYDTLYDYINRVGFKDIKYHNIGGTWSSVTTKHKDTVKNVITKSMVEVGEDSFGHKYEAAWIDYPFEYKKNVADGFIDDWHPKYDYAKMTMGSTLKTYEESYKTISSLCLQPYNVVKKINITSLNNLEILKMKLIDVFNFELSFYNSSTNIAHERLRKNNILNSGNMTIILTDVNNLYPSNVNNLYPSISFNFGNYTFINNSDNKIINDIYIKLKYIENGFNYYVYTIEEFNNRFDTKYKIKCEYGSISHNVINGEFPLNSISIDDLCKNNYILSFKVYDGNSRVLVEKHININKQYIDHKAYKLNVNTRIILNNFLGGKQLDEALIYDAAQCENNPWCTVLYTTTSKGTSPVDVNYDGLHYMFKKSLGRVGYNFSDIVSLMYYTPDKAEQDASSLNPVNFFKWIFGNSNTANNTLCNSILYLGGITTGSDINISLTQKTSSGKSLVSLYKHLLKYNNNIYEDEKSLADIANGNNEQITTNNENVGKNILIYSKELNDTDYNHYIKYENEHIIGTISHPYNNINMLTKDSSILGGFIINDNLPTSSNNSTSDDNNGAFYKTTHSSEVFPNDIPDTPAEEKSKHSNKILILGHNNINDNDFSIKEYVNINSNIVNFTIPLESLAATITTQSNYRCNINKEVYSGSINDDEHISYNFVINNTCEYRLTGIKVVFKSSNKTITANISSDDYNNDIFNNGLLFELTKNIVNNENTFINNIYVNYIYTPVTSEVTTKYVS